MFVDSRALNGRRSQCVDPAGQDAQLDIALELLSRPNSRYLNQLGAA
jgi:hypothetical protein